MTDGCPCGNAKSYHECCGPFLDGERQPMTPEELMRSRYTAYTRQDIDYVRRTTDPQTVLTMDVEASKEWAATSEFFKLEVLNSASEGNKGTVEFKAHFRDQTGAVHIHHEFSKFRRQAGVWYFRDGRVVANPS